MIFGLWLINLGVACALQAPPGRKGLKVLRTASPRTPHAARKTAARLAFTGLVATAASFAPAAVAKGGGRSGGGGSSSYSSSYDQYDDDYWRRDRYYDSNQVAVPPLVVCGFLGLSIAIDILVDPDSKPIPNGWKTRIRNAKLDEWETNREIYTSKLAATNRLMATLQDDFAAARSGAGDRLRTGRYVGRTTEADGGDQSIVANLCFQADGRVTGNGRDGVDGSYTLAGRYFEGRCAWVETYRDGLEVAVTGAVPRWPGSRLELSFVSNRGITGSASLRRVAETSGRAAAMRGAAAPVLVLALAGAAVFAPHPAYAKGGGHGGGGHGGGGHGGHGSHSSSSHWSRECEAGNQVACRTELVGDLRDTVLAFAAAVITANLFVNTSGNTSVNYNERRYETDRLIRRLQVDNFVAAAQSDKGLFRTGRYEGSTAETDGGDQSVVADLRFEDGLVTGSGVDGVDGAYTISGRYFDNRCAWIETYQDGLEVAVNGRAVAGDVRDGLYLDFASNRGVTGSARLARSASASRAAMTDVVGLVAAALRPARAGAEPSLATRAA